MIAHDSRLIYEANSTQEPPRAVIFLPEGINEELIFSKLSNKRVLPFSSLAGFRQYGDSASARLGRLVVATTPAAHRVIIVSNQRIEGLTASESGYFLQVLASAGVRTVIGGTSSRPVEAEKKEDGFVLVSDYVSRSKYPVPPLLYPDLIGARVVTERFSSKLQASAKKALSASGFNSVGSTTYFAFPGPSLPTHAERQSCRLDGKATGTFGVSGVDHLTAARGLGMDTFALNVVVSSDEATFTAFADDKTATAFVSAIIAVADSHTDEAIPIDVPLDEESKVEGDLVAQVYGRRGKQETKAHVDAAAEYLLKKAGLSKGDIKGAVFVEGDFSSIFEDSAATFRVNASELPHWEEGVGGTGNLHDRWEFVLTNIDSSLTLVIREKDVSSAIGLGNFFNLGFAVRMCHSLGVGRVVFTPTVASTDTKLTPGQFVTISDHANISANNALTGMNETEWGTRFPDMGNIYNPHIRKVITASNPNIVSVHAGEVNSSLLDSFAEARFAATMKLSVLGNNFASLAVRARHMRINVAAVAYITKSLAVDNEGCFKCTSASSDDKAALAALVKTALSAPTSE